MHVLKGDVGCCVILFVRGGNTEGNGREGKGRGEEGREGAGRGGEGVVSRDMPLDVVPN